MRSMRKQVILRVSGLNVSFDEHKILEDVSFEVKRDDTLAVIGPNGAGKTVLFKFLLGLLPYQGEINWAKDVSIGYVPQKLYVGKDVPLTVGEFLGFKEKDKSRVTRVLEMVGFGRNKRHLVHEGGRLMKSKLGVLSGGELQRVLIAFALLKNPNVLLFDEPTSFMDNTSEAELIRNLKQHIDKHTLILNTHRTSLLALVDRVIVLDRGRLILDGPKDEILNKMKSAVEEKRARETKK